VFGERVPREFARDDWRLESNGAVSLGEGCESIGLTDTTGGCELGNGTCRDSGYGTRDEGACSYLPYPQKATYGVE